MTSVKPTSQLKLEWPSLLHSPSNVAMSDGAMALMLLEARELHLYFLQEALIHARAVRAAPLLTDEGRTFQVRRISVRTFRIGPNARN